ncbi:DJ-1/PfpI family protein [Rhabdothermincola salaria]|uniref:DJ-1/PfpI family protein n=1 Tax=Rhabdothermincola salaria TaxID=2903142 RepID=UPI001E48F1D4|nr:DJ-1/PfpI family protein [Rhabdothermincola salaria]MCD9622509.1 DJ-1/PfpI family protein [Rhabdothermincola salaria]
MDATRVDICIFDGTDELDAVGPLEVLRAAVAAGADLDVRLVTRQPSRLVTAAFGLRLEPDGVFEPGAAGVIVVTGGGWARKADRGAWGEVRRGDWSAPLHDAAEAGALMTSVCTGAMLLAAAGVIGDRPATTHHAAKGDLAATGATVLDDRVVDAGSLVTAAGVTSGLDLALHLVERLVDAGTADRVALGMEHARTPAHVV